MLSGHDQEFEHGDGVHWRPRPARGLILRVQEKRKKQAMESADKARLEEIKRKQEEMLRLMDARKRIEEEREQLRVERAAASFAMEAQAKTHIAEIRQATKQLELIEKRIQNASVAITRSSSFDAIVFRMCKVFGLTQVELVSKSRCKRVVFARQAVVYWACRRTDLSLVRIGRLIGGKDHSTVLHSKRKYPQLRAEMGRKLRPTR